jgi:hypothetical protein
MKNVGRSGQGKKEKDPVGNRGMKGARKSGAQEVSPARGEGENLSGDAEEESPGGIGVGRRRVGGRAGTWKGSV